MEESKKKNTKKTVDTKSNVSKVKTKKEKQPISKKTKIIIGVSVILVIILIIVGIILFNWQQKEKEIQQIHTGLIDLKNTENAKIEDNKKINTSEELKKEKTTKGLKIKDIQLMAENALTNCTATIENVSGEVFEGKEIKIVFKNQDGSEFAIVKGFIDTIQPGESTTLSSYTMADVANAYDFEIQF